MSPPQRPRGRPAALADLTAAIRACRVCRDRPDGRPPLPHEPNPVFQVSPTARLAVCGQAPGNRAHREGRPFFDPSGVRLRAWLGIDEATFYDADKVAIVPMGFCFPGYDRHGGDLPPRPECVRTWHARLFEAMPPLALRVCVGKSALDYHLPATRRQSLTVTVRNWRAILEETAPQAIVALPHPSWRNNGWLAKNPWFEADLLPVLRERVAAALG